MAKQPAIGVLHAPLDLILTSRAKVAILRELSRSGAAVSRRELQRRVEMAYRSIEQGLGDLVGTGLVEAVGEPRSLVRLNAQHRLAPVLAALFRGEADFFPALRIALRAVAGESPAGLLTVALTGAAAGASERAGQPIELVVVGADATAARHWHDRYAARSDEIAGRFGVALRVISYDRAAAQSLWARRLPATEQLVRRAETIVGRALVEAVTPGGP